MLNIERIQIAMAGLFQLYDSDLGSDVDELPEQPQQPSAQRSMRVQRPLRRQDARNDAFDDNGNATVWVFGYGSLCWNPGFEYSKCVTGYIRGYVRRFWQGNDSHRGTKEKPGRVATLVDDPQGITWGCAYKLNGPTALDYLRQRECTLGGYVTEFTKFYPRHADDDSASDAELNGAAFPALLYVATDANQQWLGDDGVHAIARQIADCRGPSGHNVEYLIRLADFMRDEVHGADDAHLFELERAVLDVLAERGVRPVDLMGQEPQRIRRDSYEEAVRRPRSFEYASRVPDVKLRCLNI